MGQRVEVDYENGTVTAIRTLRKSGGSVVLTIPPEVVDIINAEIGDDFTLFAEHGSEEITIKKGIEDIEFDDDQPE